MTDDYSKEQMSKDAELGYMVGLLPSNFGLHHAGLNNWWAGDGEGNDADGTTPYEAMSNWINSYLRGT